MFQGVRTYALKAKNDGSTDFLMEEIFSGLMLPMIVKSCQTLALLSSNMLPT